MLSLLSKIRVRSIIYRSDKIADECFRRLAWYNSIAISRTNVMTLASSLRLNVCALVALGTTAVVAYAGDVNDYPTAARSEYVFGCLKANGETREGIEQCSS